MNQALEQAGRVADFLEFGELMCRDALHRNESCGGHFREEYQTEEGEAQRDDEHFSYAAAWEYRGTDTATGLAQGAADLRLRSPVATELQIDANLTLHVWRQKNASEPGRMVKYKHGRRQHAHVVSGDARRPQRRA